MRVYSRVGYGNGTVLVEPGADYPNEPELWTQYKDRWGFWCAKPRQIAVKFTDGCADVPKIIGRFMIRHGLASRWFWMG